MVEFAGFFETPQTLNPVLASKDTERRVYTIYTEPTLHVPSAISWDFKRFMCGSCLCLTSRLTKAWVGGHMGWLHERFFVD